MRPIVKLTAATAAVLAAGAIGLQGPASATSPSTASSHRGDGGNVAFVHANYHAVRACGARTPAGHAGCDALRLAPNQGSRVSPTAATGVTPANIQAAYKLTGLNAGGRTVAIVDAFGYPRAATDLATFRSHYGLSACTKANGCLRIINQKGGTTPPPFNLGWAQEQALDLQAVSAACPTCKILLVQTTNNSFANLGAGVNRAAKTAGVVAISNSYSGGDNPDSSLGHFYNHPGIAVTASTGDNGYLGSGTAPYPADSAYVTGVGGTTLVKATNSRGWSETAWNGAGSGCSAFNTAPTGQTFAMTSCAKHAVADVSAVADPSSGLIIFAPTSQTSSTWQQFGGTSLSSPIVAAVYALSGHTTGYANAIPYAHTSGLFDVTSGSNGSCAPTVWCNAGTGWDGPTGLGTPNGTSAF